MGVAVGGRVSHNNYDPPPQPSPTRGEGADRRCRSRRFHFNGIRFSGVDLTFATHLAASPRSECQIQNSTSTLYLLVVL